VVLLKLILQIGEQKLSIIRTLCDQYINTLRSFAGFEASEQQPLVQALFSVFEGDYGLLNIVLDILMRRNIILPSAVATYIAHTADLLSGLHDNLFMYSIAE
jgi:hypothetical protein